MFTSTRAAGAAFGAACALLAAGASPALAGTYEQISRATGPQGAAPFTHDNQVVAASDDGRFGVFRSSDNAGAYATYARNIRDNVTSTLAKQGEQVWGFDAAEKLVLVSHLSGDSLAFVLRSVQGGPERTVYTIADASLLEASAALSGNGRTVAIAGGDDLAVVDAVTLRVKHYAVEGAHVGPRSLSDDGSVVAGVRAYANGFAIARGQVKPFDNPVVVSPNGAVIATTGAKDPSTGIIDQVVATRLADGLTRRYDLPEDAGRRIGWIAPDGARVAVTGGDNGGTPYLLNLGSGQLAKFGGAFADDLAADLSQYYPAPGAQISRNGRYAVVQYGRGLTHQLALVSLTGTDLPGAQEPLSASSYANVSYPLGVCGQDGSISISFQRPAPWAHYPKSADVKITSDTGTTVLDKAFPTAYDPADFSTFQFPTIATYPAATKQLTITATVDDGQRHTLTDTETRAPICFGGGDGSF